MEGGERGVEVGSVCVGGRGAFVVVVVKGLIKIAQAKRCVVVQLFFSLVLTFFLFFANLRNCCSGYN